jgi:midasin (ATPase involved in ribosome maturation)
MEYNKADMLAGFLLRDVAAVLRSSEMAVSLRKGQYNKICNANSPSPLDAMLRALCNRSVSDTKLDACMVAVGNTFLPTKSTGTSSTVAPNKQKLRSHVPTLTSDFNLRSLAQAVLTQRPIVVQGASGSGKSHLIRTLAAEMDLDGDIIELHINDQTDSKTLIGSYVCSDVPGEFVWQAGVLTQAVLAGRWVVIENLDHVPMEFVAAIAPLLSRRRIYLPNRDMEVVAHPNFRLFGTRVAVVPNVRSARPKTFSTAPAALVDYNSLIYIPTLMHFSYFWHYVNVHTLALEEVRAIVTHQYPTILPILMNKLLAAYLYINGYRGDSNSSSSSAMVAGGGSSADGTEEVGTSAVAVVGAGGRKRGSSGAAADVRSNMQKWGTNKSFGLREMLKAAGRIQANCGEFNHVSGFATDLQKRIALQEVLDVFAGSIRSREGYEEAVREIGGIWGISESELETYFLNTAADVASLFVQQQHQSSTSSYSSSSSSSSSSTSIGAGGAGLSAISKRDGMVMIGRATLSLSTSNDNSNNNSNSNSNNNDTKNSAGSGGAKTAREKLGLDHHQQEQEQAQAQQREQNFAMTKYSLRLLERVAVCVARREPVLLVGETGTGKTTSVQELADMLGKRLSVQNLSLSTDVADLLGGFRPVTMKQLFLPVYEVFVRLFNDTLSSSQNTEFLQIVAKFYQAQSWRRLLKAFLKAADQATKKLSKMLAAEKVKPVSSGIDIADSIEQWASFRAKIARYDANLPKIEHGFAFQFVDGLLVDALRNGDWVLLDEINLASSETLQGLSGVLDADSALFLTEKGSGELVPVERHADFRIFAAMNPPTDVGKKELPASLLSRFTELYTEELTDPQDLKCVVERYLAGINTAPVEDIVSVYLGCRAAADDHLTDSTGQRPRYSLRSLTRSLQAAKSFLALGIRPFPRALVEAFLLNFQTMLSDSSRVFMHAYLKSSLYGQGVEKESGFPPTRPGGRGTTGEDWALVKPFWLRTGALSPVDWAQRDADTGVTRFVLTKTVESNIRTLAGAVGAQVAPILIQVRTDYVLFFMIRHQVFLIFILYLFFILNFIFIFLFYCDISGPYEYRQDGHD